MIDRRQWLAGSAALLCTSAWAADESSLDALARARGLRFGTALSARLAAPADAGGDPAYQALIAGQCGLIVPENEMKWGAVRPSVDRFEFGGADRLVAWARAHGLGVRGHNLLWQHPRWTPDWLTHYDFGPQPRATAERLLRDHVTRVADRYAGVVHSFNVVNEAVDEKTGALRETSLSRAIGGTVETIAIAFDAARQAAPSAQLVYNDYMSWDAGSAAHRAGVLRLLEALRQRGVPIDALGIQGHIGSSGTGQPTTLAAQAGEWRRFLDAVAAMKLGMLVTEFDVNDKGLPADIPTRDRAVADLARAFLDQTLAYPQVDTLMCWGLSDRYSWLQHIFLRDDGLPKRPLPYDDAFRAKPLRTAIAASLRAAPARAGPAQLSS